MNPVRASKIWPEIYIHLLSPAHHLYTASALCLCKPLARLVFQLDRWPGKQVGAGGLITGGVYEGVSGARFFSAWVREMSVGR